MSSTPAAAKYVWGTGRRKTSVARVRCRPGTGTFLVNGRELNEYFPDVTWQSMAKAPLASTERLTKVDVLVNAYGGGFTGQSGAICMGLARALMAMEPETEATLREHGLMTRDARMVERKKYGKAGARRSYQFSKR